MSKKKHRPDAALLEARLIREREWCYARWMERMTFRQISAASAMPLEAGGLGNYLSVVACRHMVHAYREERGEMTMSRDERRERMADELDETARHLRLELARGKAETGRLDLKVVDALLAIGKREADLHGLAAPAEIKAEIVTRSNIDAEIDAMLERMGEAPLSTPERNTP